MTAESVLARYEPPGLLSNDGKWQDSTPVISKQSGKYLVWAATCVDTFAPSCRSLAAHEAGAIATRAELFKDKKYSNLIHTYHEFTLVALESSRVFGPQSLLFVKELGRKLRHQTGQEKAAAYLIQCLSIVLQQGNAMSILECVGSQRCQWTWSFLGFVLFCTCTHY